MSQRRFRFLCNFTLPAVFLTLFLYPAPGRLQDSSLYLTPPGLRSVKDPSVVVPAIHPYLNQPLEKPAYRKTSGNPAKGWAAKYVDTRRFSSNQSAWIYYRMSDLADAETWESSQGLQSLRIWPVGATIVLESYQGDAVGRNGDQLIEVLVMHKISDKQSDPAEAFYSANWCYARFTPQGELSIHAQKTQECHQCHSIAFHLTGDLTFTQLP
jgi:hypothetical protein